MRHRQPITPDLVKVRVTEFVSARNLLWGCVRKVFSTPPGEDPPLLSEAEYLRSEIFGSEEPDLLTRREQLKQIRRALREAENQGER
jgi:hypothetical protein